MDGRGVAGVGVIGAGTISEQYLGNLAAYPDVEVLSVADLDVAGPPRRPPRTASRTPAGWTSCWRGRTSTWSST